MTYQGHFCRTVVLITLTYIFTLEIAVGEARMAPNRPVILEVPQKHVYVQEQAQAAVSQSDGILVVRFEEGKQSSSTGMVISALLDTKIIEVKEYEVKQGDTLCMIYKNETSYEGICPEDDVLLIVNKLNERKINPRSIMVGEIINIPDVHFNQYEYYKYFHYDREPSRRNLERTIERLGGLVSHRAPTKYGKTRVTLRGQELRIRTTREQAADAISMIYKGDISNVIADYVDDEKKESPVHGSEGIGHSEFMSQCMRGMIEFKTETYLENLLSKPDQQCDRKCRDSYCPEIILVDKPIANNPDLICLEVDAEEAATGDELCEIELTVNNNKEMYSCRMIQSWTNDYHGTHLAGIINARENGIGTVGIDPNVQVYSVNFDALEPTDVADIIEARADRDGMQIYVMANEYKYPETLVSNGEISLTSRFTANAIASRIKHISNSIWIVAAGQVHDGEPGIVKKRTAIGPRNLGDLENVLVVTACSDCLNEPTLLAEANYSQADKNGEHMVHVAAPGVSIISTANENAYAVGSGTSQATAFVAGVVSKMIGCYPDDYKTPETIKTRIQMTAEPYLDDKSISRLASGVVDPRRALLNPKKIWMRLDGDNSDQFMDIAISGWCEEGFVMREAFTNDLIENIRTKDIYRIVRARSVPQSNLPQWFIYTKVPWDAEGNHRGSVLRIGPGILGKSSGGNYDVNAPILQQSGGSKIALTELEEIFGKPVVSRKKVGCN